MPVISALVAARTMDPSQFELWCRSQRMQCTHTGTTGNALQMDGGARWGQWGHPFPDLYAVLGVDEACDDAAIQRAFVRQMLVVHPDKIGPMASAAERDAATLRTRQLLQAREVLLCAEQRAAYDAERRSRRDRGGAHEGEGEGAQQRQGGGAADPPSMADAWEVWIRVVFDAFTRQYSAGNQKAQVLQLLASVVPPALGVAVGSPELIKLGGLLMMAFNQNGIAQLLRELPARDQQLFMQAVEALSTRIV